MKVLPTPSTNLESKCVLPFPLYSNIHSFLHLLHQTILNEWWKRGEWWSVNVLDLPPDGRSSLVSLWLPLLGRHSVHCAGGGRGMWGHYTTVTTVMLYSLYLMIVKLTKSKKKTMIIKMEFNVSCFCIHHDYDYDDANDDDQCFVPSVVRAETMQWWPSGDDCNN